MTPHEVPFQDEVEDIADLTAALLVRINQDSDLAESLKSVLNILERHHGNVEWTTPVTAAELEAFWDDMREVK